MHCLLGILLPSTPHEESILALFLYEQWWLDAYLQQLNNHTTQCNTTTLTERDAWNSLTVMQNTRESEGKSFLVPGRRGCDLIRNPLSSTDGELSSMTILSGDLEVWADGAAVPTGWMYFVSSLVQWIAVSAGPNVSDDFLSNGMTLVLYSHVVLLFRAVV